MLEKQYTTEVVEICENGDAILQLPPEMCTDLDWRENDTLKLSVEGDAIIIQNLDCEKRKNVSST